MSLTTHGACGRTWKQVGNRTSHCSGCHETFAGLRLFEAHRRDGRCLHPTDVLDHETPLELETGNGSHGVWYSPGARAAISAAFPKEDR